MTERSEKALRKIISYSSKIVTYIDGFTYEAFCSDTKTLEAVVFNLSQIG